MFDRSTAKDLTFQLMLSATKLQSPSLFLQVRAFAFLSLCAFLSFLQQLFYLFRFLVCLS